MNKNTSQIPTFTKIRDSRGKLIGYQAWFGNTRLATVKTWKEAREYSKRVVAAQLPFSNELP